MEHQDNKYTELEKFCRPFTTAELIEMVDNEKFWEDMENVDIFITPPEYGDDSEEDNADENEGKNINHLSGRQLQAQAVATVHKKRRYCLFGRRNGR